MRPYASDRTFPPRSRSELYPSNQVPLERFIDGRGRVSRLYWGFTGVVAPERGFFSGKGYKHIAAKHGWGPADEQVTRNAIHRRPIKTESIKVRKRRLVRRTYEGGRYRQNMTSCRRVVVIDYPVQSRSGGEIISSYGAVVGEPGSPLPNQA